MEDLRKITYEPPVMRVAEVRLEGIVCNHTGEVPDMEHGWDLDF